MTLFRFQLPAIRPHNKLLLRLVIVVRRKSNNKPHILVSEKTAVHLPVCEINPTRSIHSTLKVSPANHEQPLVTYVTKLYRSVIYE